MFAGFASSLSKPQIGQGSAWNLKQLKEIMFKTQGERVSNMRPWSRLSRPGPRHHEHFPLTEQEERLGSQNLMRAVLLHGSHLCMGHRGGVRAPFMTAASYEQKGSPETRQATGSKASDPHTQGMCESYAGLPRPLQPLPGSVIGQHTWAPTDSVHAHTCIHTCTCTHRCSSKGPAVETATRTERKSSLGEERGCDWKR